jgi:CRISPR/Cas system CMR-associated protein Cmr1 (group 7 of RAMP superfamily)
MTSEFKIIYVHLLKSRNEDYLNNTIKEFEDKVNKELKEGWKVINVIFNCANNEFSSGYQAFLVRDK